MNKYQLAITIAATAIVATACPDDPELDPTIKWRAVFEEMPGAMLRVVGSSARDVYLVGADGDGAGPIFMHFDGDRWTKIPTPGITGDLWWVEIIGPDDVRAVGEGGMVLTYRPSTGELTKRTAPTPEVLFGVWGASSNDAWYVGGNVGVQTGVIWRDDGTTISAPVPAPTATSSATIFKIYGFEENKIWAVGQRGRTIYYDGQTLLEPRSPKLLSLMGIHGTRADHVFAVGGASSGVLLAWNGTEWIDESVPLMPQMSGVWATSDEEAIAVGFNGNSYRRTAAGWAKAPEPLPTFRDLHAVWVDDEGGIWAVGGQLASTPPTQGMLVYYGPEISHEIVEP